MASVKFSELPALGETPSAGDLLALSDVSAGLSKSVRFDQLVSGPASFIHQATRTPLTNAQIQTLPTLPVQVVANADSNIALICIGTSWIPIGGVGYSNVEAASAGGISDGFTGFHTVYPYPYFFENFGSAYHFDGISQISSSILRSGAQISGGRGLYVEWSNNGEGNFGDGDAGNSLLVSVIYLKLNLTTGVYE